MGSEIIFWGPPTFFLMAPQMGCTFWISFWSLQCFFLAMFAECVSSFVRLTTDHHDPINYQNAPSEIFGFCFATCHPLDALLAISSRSWPMPCASTKPSQGLTSIATRLATTDLRSGGWSDAELGGPSRASRSNGSYYCKWFHNL